MKTDGWKEPVNQGFFPLHFPPGNTNDDQDRFTQKYKKFYKKEKKDFHLWPGALEPIGAVVSIAGLVGPGLVTNQGRTDDIVHLDDFVNNGE